MSSFKAYGKVNEDEQAKLAARRRTRRRVLIIALSSIVLVGVVVAAVVGTYAGKSKSGADHSSSLSSSVKTVCDFTQYPDSCYSSLSSAGAGHSRPDPQQIFLLSLQVAVDAISRAFSELVAELKGLHGFPLVEAAMSDCQELLESAADHINGSLHSPHDLTSEEIVDDLRTWLSAAMTDIDTCADGVGQVAPELLKAKLESILKNSTVFTSNSLAIVTKISEFAKSLRMRRLLSYDEMPSWVSSKDRKLLQTSNPSNIKADIVVAKDGSGKYKTIKAALAAVPDKSKKRTVIYVKKGVYNEQVRVEKSKWNVMMVGDGKDATVVTGNKNFVDGTTTFKSASFATFGKGFMARDMGFRNTAGASKHQAVAMMTSADEAVFYRCKFDAFQDTLYVHSLRQFYRDCDVYGTVDFIFGNAAAVLQNCNIRPRVPMHGQQDTITAQGKADPNQNTGISIHNCIVSPFGNLAGVNTYLGRPWKLYSTTVYMKSELGGVIHPSGWMPWTGNSAPSTIFYGEYANRGAGASTRMRVKWKGLRFLNAKQAEKFTVKPFTGGDKWISNAGVPYSSAL